MSADEVTIVDVIDEQIELWQQRLGDLHARAIESLTQRVYVASSILDAIDKLERQLSALESVRWRAAITTDDEGEDDGSDK